MDGGPTDRNARTTPPELSGLIKLGLEVGGVRVRLGAVLDSEEWHRACLTSGFSRVGFFGKLAMGAGLAEGKAYSTKNQALQLFGGKVFVAPDLYDGPVRYGTSAVAFFRRNSLYRVAVGVTGNTRVASNLARQCTRALQALLGEPSQGQETGTLVWTGRGDRLTLRCTDDAYLVHELTSGS